MDKIIFLSIYSLQRKGDKAKRGSFAGCEIPRAEVYRGFLAVSTDPHCPAQMSVLSWSPSPGQLMPAQCALRGSFQGAGGGEEEQGHPQGWGCAQGHSWRCHLTCQLSTQGLAQLPSTPGLPKARLERGINIRTLGLTVG